MAIAMTADKAWSHLTAWPAVGGDRPLVELSADAATKKAVARFLDIESVEHLSARLRVQAWLDGAEVTGEIEAEVWRLCSLSLEPFKARLVEPLFIKALPVGSENEPPPPSGEVDLNLEAEDPPEILGVEGLDLGDLVVQTLALALDPFPRKPGSIFAPPASVPEPSPFEALAHLTLSKGKE